MEEKISLLQSVLKEVKEWIDNWEPDFVDDPEWDETAEKIKLALSKDEDE